MQKAEIQRQFMTWQDEMLCILGLFAELVGLVEKINNHIRVYTCYLVLMPCWGVMGTIYLSTVFCGTSSVSFAVWTCRHLMMLMVIMCPAVALHNQVSSANVVKQ